MIWEYSMNKKEAVVHLSIDQSINQSLDTIDHSLMIKLPKNN